MAACLFDELRQKVGAASGLRTVAPEEKKDRSAANVQQQEDVLDDEEERWKYFFDSGCSVWFNSIKSKTFSTSFCSIDREEAQLIVDHWEKAKNAEAKLSGEVLKTALMQNLQETMLGIAPLIARLQKAIDVESKLSPASKVFVKLSTRSPKDSSKVLRRAKTAYYRRAKIELEASEDNSPLAENSKWRILCEEVTRASSVSDAEEAMLFLLDSARIYEDLEYALSGPIRKPGTASEQDDGMPMVGDRNLPVNLAVRAWDPRLKPESEFRGICWDGKLTCLCQYFHPLYFPELQAKVIRDGIVADIKAVMNDKMVKDSISMLGGHCIIDFAWLSPGKVIIIELNPFDGICLGTFPASTGLFLWENPKDNLIMRGVAPFEFRIRTEPSPSSVLKSQVNPAWRRIIYETETSRRETLLEVDSVQ